MWKWIPVNSIDTSPEKYWSFFEKWQPECFHWWLQQTSFGWLHLFWKEIYRCGKLFPWLILCMYMSVRQALIFINILGLPWCLSGIESICQLGDSGSVPALGPSPAKGNGNPLPYSCLRNPMDRGAWWATVPRVPKSGTRLTWLSMHLLINVQNKRA